MKLEIIVVSPEKNILKYFVISIICNNRFNVKKCMILGSSKPWAYSLMAGVLGFSFPRHFTNTKKIVDFYSTKPLKVLGTLFAIWVVH